MPPLVAINIAFSVLEHRREEFLAQIEARLKLEQQQQQGEKLIHKLIQFVIGEDPEKSGSFYLHLKYQFLSDDDENDITAFLAQKASAATDDIFLNTTISSDNDNQWRQFTATKPFSKDPTPNIWVVAKETANSNPNPKPITQGQPVFCMNASLHVQSKYRDQLVTFLELARRKSIQEPLCIEYQYGESVTQPNIFHVHQEYTGNGFDVHAKTLHYQEWKAFAETKPFHQKPVGYKYRALTGSTKLPKTTFTTEQQNTILLLDGGSGHELKERGINDGSFLAGLLANENQPDIVQSMHRDFCSSGCHVITTNSFVAVPNRILEEGLASDTESAKERTRQLIAAAVQNARQAVSDDNNQQRIKVAGTIPPLTECYIASLVPQVEEMVPNYQFLISSLLEEQVDILLAETLSSSSEALAIIQATALAFENNSKQSDSIPLWISMTIDDFKQPTTLRSGEPLDEALSCILEESNEKRIHLQAIGVNCASPTAITHALPILVEAANSGPLVPSPRVLAYGNAFQTSTSEWLESLLNDSGNDDESSNKQTGLSSITGAGDYDKSGCMHPEVYANHAREWARLGASIIGGCCGVSPRHMQAVADSLLLLSA